MTPAERRSGRPSGRRLNLAMPHAEPVKRWHDGGAVRRWLASLADDPWYAINPVPVGAPAFLDFCRLGSRVVSYAVTGRRWDGADLKPATVQALGNVKEMMDDGRLFFIPKMNRGIGGGRGHTKVRAIVLEPPAVTPRPQPRVLPRGDYKYWSRCRSCGSRRYYAIVIGAADSAACYDCLPPARLASIGATVSTRRLQLDMLEDD